MKSEAAAPTAEPHATPRKGAGGEGRAEAVGDSGDTASRTEVGVKAEKQKKGGSKLKRARGGKRGKQRKARAALSEPS